MNHCEREPTTTREFRFRPHDGMRKMPAAANTSRASWGTWATSRVVHIRTLVAMVAWLLLALVAPPAVPSAQAQDNFGIDSYITPFPKDDVYRIQVVGDSLAEGLQGVLSASLGKDPRVRVESDRWKFKHMTSDYFETHVSDLRSGVYRNAINILVVMVGAWDRRNMTDKDGHRVRKGSGDWRTEYVRRVDKMMKTLKTATVSVYWVGLPPFSRNDANEDAQLMNEVLRERAYLNGVRFIDTYQRFLSDEGGYEAYGPDLSGKIRLLRERDGIHLSYAGNQKLAHFIEEVVMRDLEIARKERAIPLDGDTQEQATIKKLAAAAKAQPEPGGTIGWLSGLTGSSGDGSKDDRDQGGGGYLGGGLGGEQRAENTRINLATVDPTGREQIISIDIVRPAIPASVVALVTRKQREDKLTPMGDTLVDQISDGINIMSSVTPADQLSSGSRRFSPAQTPFFRVLVKGERVQPRVGRADDISWPRPQPPERRRLSRSVAPDATNMRRPGGSIDFGREDGRSGGVPLPGANPFRPRA